MTIIRDVRNNNVVPDLDSGHIVSDLSDNSNALMAHGPWRSRRSEQAVESMKVASTYGGGCEAHDGIAWILDCGLWGVFDGDVEGFAFPKDRAHGFCGHL